MAMDLEKRDLVMRQEKLIDSFNENGFVHLKGFFKKEELNTILIEAKEVFYNQFLKLNLTDQKFTDLSLSEFDNLLYELFDKDMQAFTNCGKQVQHLMSLHSLSLKSEVKALLNEVGVLKPVISTRPVMFFNHKHLSKERVYYYVDSHQDWRSMQGSLNSVVLWVPLMAIIKDLGALGIVPKSHKKGLVTSNVGHGFGYVNLSEDDKYHEINIELELGDALLFSSFLIHRSGENVTDTPRWSCHFRYNDLSEKTFIQRGYPHPYIYRPDSTLLTENFPTKEQVNNIFK
jgi:phytanoyl-CoA hydroxylase